MKRVLRLAEKGRGRTSPNPMVGAILVRRGDVIGQGYHRKAGEPHAEVLALRQAGKKAQGATLYLNLEPCTHYGRTPPCAPQIIQAKVKRAVIGMEDPNPRVQGKGVRSLREAGLEVEVGTLERECQRLNEAFSKYILEKVPFVILKAASTLDGKIATRTGESKWISGEASRRLVHRLRGQVDGVVVGIGTVLKDDPLLTSRVKGGRDPYRIVLDSRLRIPEGANVMERSPSKTIIATTREAPTGKVERLREKGVHILMVDSEGGRVDLKECLKKLGEMGLMSLMVEGGSQIHGAFLDKELADKALLFFSPKLMGDPQAPGIFGGRGAQSLKDAIRIEALRQRRIGEDILIEGYFQKGEEPCLVES